MTYDSYDRDTRTTVERINDCSRHQNPEAFGGAPVADPEIPPTIRYGPDSSVATVGEHLAPEPMGDPAARSLDAEGTITISECA